MTHLNNKLEALAANLIAVAELIEAVLDNKGDGMTRDERRAALEIKGALPELKKEYHFISWLVPGSGWRRFIDLEKFLEATSGGTPVVIWREFDRLQDEPKWDGPTYEIYIGSDSMLADLINREVT